MEQAIHNSMLYLEEVDLPPSSTPLMSQAVPNLLRWSPSKLQMLMMLCSPELMSPLAAPAA